ncbi:MAG: 4Fe-4S dicluster domain-containing protein [Thermoanaerobaculaceae bacterium]|nr:4Fe-4S dicluster domain-containing protein [Thermoanaerobaculaceae bacterium]TAM54564.1 MAG: 4Fe-4S dicluster domain-containing protein [Acidobacteriota bacterium]
MAHRGILVDVTKCIGCGSCVEACQKSNEQPAHEAKGFNEQTYTFLMDRGNDTYVRRLCMHCENPSCASVCPVGALRKTAAGPVTYDPDKCMGCRYCMMACPFGVPTYEWHSAAPRVRKCQMCAHRGAAGPACAEACPTGATITGERDELLAEARRRVASDPKAYFQRVYGVTEAGGTGVLFIGPREPAALGLPPVKTVGPLPDLTWNALKHIPDVVLFGGVFLGGLFWLTKRKEDVARAEHADKGEHHG